MGYQNVIDKIQEHNLSWDEIDRILLNPETYEEFKERASFETSTYETNDKPAVRETTGEEKIIYASEDGRQVTVKL